MRIGARAHHSTSCTYMTVRIRLRIRWRRSSELSEICWPVFAGPAHCSVPAGRPQLLPPLPPPSRSHRGTMPTPQSLFAAARPRPPRRACRVGPGRTAPRRCAEAIDAPSELCGWHSRAVGAAAGNLPPVQELKSELAALRAAAKQGGVEASGFEPPPSSDSTRPPPNNDWPGKAPRGATPKWRNSFGNADTYAASAASEAARRRPAFAGLGNDDSDDADRAGGMEGNRGPTQQPGSFNSNPPGASSCAGASPRAYQCSGGDGDDVDSRVSEWGLYGTLGIRPNASYADIRRAFRRMALQCHPDKVRAYKNFHVFPLPSQILQQPLALSQTSPVPRRLFITYFLPPFLNPIHGEHNPTIHNREM